MSQKFLITVALIIGLFGLSADEVSAQRKAVSGAEVTGTYRLSFTGKFKGSSSDILIQALGKNKLKVGFDLIYPFVDPTGELSANLGKAVGEARIEGDTATYTTSDEEKCEITIKFVKPGVIKVTQNEATCGFGFNVTAEGTYKKVSSKKPKFDLGI
jgi:hypothetical protein